MPSCSRCNALMVPGQAMEPSTVDFAGRRSVSRGLISVLKCPECGHSATYRHFRFEVYERTDRGFVLSSVRAADADKYEVIEAETLDEAIKRVGAGEKGVWYPESELKAVSWKHG